MPRLAGLACLGLVAVLAGFSGIVIAFGRRSVGTLSALEIRRLTNLFTLSGMALSLSLLRVSLLHLGVADSRLFWSWASGAVFLLATPWLILDQVKVTRLDESEKAQINISLFAFFDSLAAVTLALQLYNWLSLKQPWAFFLALTLMTAGAFQQFVLLVRMGIQKGGTADDARNEDLTNRNAGQP